MFDNKVILCPGHAENYGGSSNIVSIVGFYGNRSYGGR